MGNKAPLSVVWVVGAGLSAGIGGPLLKSLFSPLSGGMLREYFPDAPKLNSVDSDRARLLFQHGEKNSLWQDPEDFLDRLDTAALLGENTAAWNHMQQLINSVVPEQYNKPPSEYIFPDRLSFAAKRCLAAECSAFLVNANPRSERWVPYVQWADKLSGKHTLDTIISFNYDRALELIGAELLRTSPAQRRSSGVIDIATPGGGVHDNQPYVDVLKLHGSIDWKRTENGRYEPVSDNPFFAIQAEDRELGIASPGPTKQSSVAALEDLWRYAERALEHADAIMFVGYRFPPTDAVARNRLLSAIHKNVNVPNCHILLGPNANGEDAMRLRGLLRFALQATVAEANIEVHPLYSQDFFSVYEPARFHSLFAHRRR